MTGSVQSMGVSVIGKKTALSKYGVGNEVTLQEASIVQINAARADIKSVARQGQDLLVTLVNGEVVTVKGYFHKQEGGRSNIVLDDDLEGLWLLALGGGTDSGVLPFEFTTIHSIDPLLAETGASDERNDSVGIWFAGLGALTVAAMAYDGDSGGHPPVPPKDKPSLPTVDPVNGVKPITGHCDPGNLITVTMPDGSTVSVIADADGYFSVTNPGLNDQDKLTVVATSPEGEDSDPVTVTVDAISPDAPSVEPVNATDPIVGHAEPGSTITVTLPDGSTLMTQAGPDGSFQIENPGLKDGDKLDVSSTDAAGNVSDKTEVIVDALSPALSISDDIPGTLGKDGTVTFTFTFSEDVKGFDASKIHLQGGVAGKFVVVSGSVYTLEVTSNLTENGAITITVDAGAAHDAAGNPSLAGYAEQDVDPLAPGAGSLYDIVLIDDYGPIVGEIKPGDLTDDDTPTYQGKADPSDVALVRIYDNGKEIGTVAVQPDGTWSFEPSTPLSAGPHSFQAEPVDAAGNVGERTEALQFDLVSLVPVAPEISGVYDDVGMIIGPIEKGVPTDDNQPTLEGKAAPGTIVKIWDGDILVGTAEVDANGHWSVTTSVLSDGEHRLTATATNGAGQVSPPSDEYLVLVDTVAPGKPHLPDLYGSDQEHSLTGTENPMVDILTPTLAGKGDAGDLVVIYDKGVKIGTAVVGNDGTWSFVPSTPLSQGNHDVTVTLTDRAGNVSQPSDTLHFTVDTSTEPLIISYAIDDYGMITGHVPFGGATDDVTPTLVGTAPAGVTVTVYDGVTRLGTTQADASGQWSLELPVQSEGTHTYRATAENAAGRELSATFEVTIDITALSTPTIDFVSDDVGPVQHDLVSGESTDDTTPTIHGSGPAGELVYIYNNNQLVGKVQVDGSGKWQYTITPPLTEEGEHALTVTSVDAVGNESAHSDEFVVVLDLTPPDISNVVLTVDKVAGDDYVNANESQENITLTGKLENVPADATRVTLVVTVNGIDYVATLKGSHWSVDVPGSVLVAGGEGAASLIVNAVIGDAAGNDAHLQVTHDYMVDTVPPPEAWETITASLWDDVGPVQGEIVSGTATDDVKPTYRGVAESSAEVAYVEVLDNGKVIGRAKVQPDGSWSFEPDLSLMKGSHAFQARPVDAAGNIGKSTPIIDFTVVGAQPQPPAIENVEDNVGPIVGNIQKGVPTDDTTPTLSGTAEVGTVVRVYDVVNGVLVLVGETEVQGNGQWRVEVDALSEGAHALVATATDAAGQESVTTGEYIILVDTTPPETPAMPTAFDRAGEKTGPILPGDVSDDTMPELGGVGEAGAKVLIYDKGILLGSTMVKDDGTWSYTPAIGFQDGDHSLTVTLTDVAGNVSQPSESLDFTMDTHGLELVIEQVLDDQGIITGPIPNGGATDDTTPTFVGRATPGATITIYEGATEIASVVADEGGRWTLTLSSQGEGPHDYVVSALSVAGNTVTAHFALTIDTTPSDAPIIISALDDVGAKQGALANGGVTDDTTPTLQGTGVTGDTIRIYDNGSYVGSTGVDPYGNWYFTLTPAMTDEGRHELTATSVDPVGNESGQSDPFVIYLDVTAPDLSSVHLTINPVTDDNVINAAESHGSVLLSGGMSGVPADATAVVVNIIVNGVTYLGTVSGNTWNVSVPGGELVADIGRQVEAIAKFSDDAGNTAQMTVTQGYGVDVTPPDLSEVLFQYALMDDVGPIQGEIHQGEVTDDAKPRYVGLTDPNEVATVRLYDNGLYLGSCTVQTDGTWWIEPNLPLSAGPHQFQLQALDAAGNESLLTLPLDFTLLGAAPQAPAITGVYDDAGANIQPHQPTNDGTPTLEGTAAPGTTVKIFELTSTGERILLASVSVDGQGHWRVSTSQLGDGAHDLIATTTDGAGQESVPTGAYPVIVDTVAPDKPGMVEAIDDVGDKTGPIANGETTDDAMPLLKGTGEAGTKVTIYDGSQVIGTTTINDAGEWTFMPPSALAQGDHIIYVTLTDRAGNVSEKGDALSFKVGVDGVELIIEKVMDDQGKITGPIPNGGATDDTTPTFVGRATPRAMVTIYENGAKIASVIADDAGHWSVTLPEQGAGAHAYVVGALSVEGNTTTVNFGLTIDTTPSDSPNIQTVLDDVGAKQGLIANGGITDDTTPTLQGKGVTGDTIHLYDNGSYVGSTTVDKNGNWTYTIHPALTNEGRHELTAVSEDPVGNESQPGDPFVIYLDVTPPDVSKVGLTVNPVTDDNTINESESHGMVTLSGTLTHLPDDVAETQITVRIGNRSYTATLQGEAWSVDVNASELVANVEHRLEVTAAFWDAAGNEAQRNVTGIYDVKLEAPPAGSLHDIVVIDDVGSIQGELKNGDPTDDPHPTIMGKADVPEVAKVQILDNGVVLETVEVSADGSWMYEPTDPLTVGLHSFQYRPIDKAGNIGELTDPFFLTMAGEPPPPPVIEGTDDGDPETGDVLHLVSSYDPAVNPQPTMSAKPVNPAITQADGIELADAPSRNLPDTHVGARTFVTGAMAPRAQGETILYTKNTTPTLKGTAVAGTIVKLYDRMADGSTEMLGTAKTDAQGIWSITTTKLAENIHALIATSTDVAGQVSAPSLVFKLVVDITAPDKPELPQILDQVGEVVGVVIGGSVMDDAKPLIKGVGEPAAKVKVYDNGILIGSTEVDAGGHWSLQLTTPLSEGPHSISVTLADKAGNVSVPSDAMVFSLDTSQVMLSISRVTDDVGLIQGEITNGGATDDATPTFAGNATPAAKIMVYEAGKLIAATVADDHGHWVLELPVQSDGPHDYLVQAVNAAGNTVQATFSLSVDTEAPEIPTIDSVIDDVGSVQGVLVNGAVTDDATPTLKGTGSRGEVVKVQVDGVEVGSVTVDDQGFWTFTVQPPLSSDGRHVLTAVSIDAVGNMSAPSSEFVILLDTTPPTLSGTTLTINNVTDDNVINQAESQGTVTLSGQLLGVPEDSVSTQIIVLLNGSEYAAVRHGDMWSVDVRGSALVDDADHTVEVKAFFTDLAGNTSELMVSRNYEVKSVPPELTSLYDIVLYDDVGSIQGVIVSGAVTDDHKPTYSGKASPGVTQIDILDNGKVIGQTSVMSDGSWSFEPSIDLLEGSHTLQARPVDYAGNEGAPTGDITFLVAGAPPEPPTIWGVDDDPVEVVSVAAVAMMGEARLSPMAYQAAAPANPKPSIVTNETTPTLKGGALAGTHIKLYVQDDAGQWNFVGECIADASGKWAIQCTSELSEGLHSFKATSTDESGQISAPSVEFLLQVDITPPATLDVPKIWDDVGPIQGEVPDGGTTDDRRPTITGTGEAGAKVTVYDRDIVLGTATVDANGAWTLALASDLAEGTHVIWAKQKDPAGNWSQPSDSIQFSVDTIAPDVTSTVFFLDNVGSQQGLFGPGSVTDDRTPTLVGTLSQRTEAGGRVEIYEGSALLGVAVLNGLDWTFDLPKALSSLGSHAFRIVVSDAAGNAAVAAEIDLSVVLMMSVNALQTTDKTPLLAGTIGAELLAGEHVQVTVNGVKYSSQDGTVAVDWHSGVWYLQIPDSGALGVGRHQITCSLVDSIGNVLVEASGAVAVDARPAPGAGIHTDWATAPGEATNNTLVFGLNGDGLWIIGANRHLYSSSDLSTYTAAALGKLSNQVSTRTAVSMTAGDFERRGAVDVIGTENRYDGNYQIMWKNNGANFTPQKMSTGCAALYWGAVIAYDKTGDGYLDLAYGDRYGDSVTYLVNNKGKFAPDTNILGNAGMWSCAQSSFGEVSAVDINGNGTVDIVRHDLAKGCYTLSVINNNGKGSLTPGQSIANVFYGNQANSVTAASMTWADFNGDGYMDLYLASGYAGKAGTIYYNDGTGLLNTTGRQIEVTATGRCFLPAPTGFLSVAVDWNHDGRMDVVKFSNYGASQTATLYTNNGSTAWVSKVLSQTLSKVTGIAAMDYNWDGAQDLIVSQQNGKVAYIQNNEKVADGTAMHLRIVDSEGINVFYGNTVQLFDSSGKLVAAQILNAQSGYGVNDTSGIVNFYGLNPSETYTAKLLKVTNGVSDNVSWSGLEAREGSDAYVLTANSAAGGKTGTVVGTGYNDTFIVESGDHVYNGGGGWVDANGERTWSATGGLDVVDFRNAGSGVQVDLSKAGMQGNAQFKATLLNIEGVAGSEFDDALFDDTGDNWIQGRGGNDMISLLAGGKDTLSYTTIDAKDATGGNGRDTVIGFKLGSWEVNSGSDRIDLHDLLIGYQSASKDGFAAKYLNGVATINEGDGIERYLKTSTSAEGTELQVDRHGDGSEFSTLLTLTGVHTDLATLLANHQITLV